MTFAPPSPLSMPICSQPIAFPQEYFPFANDDDAIGEMRDPYAPEDPVRFEILVPETVWEIPANQPGAFTSVQLGLRVTNLSKKLQRFSWCCPLRVRLEDSKGQKLVSRLLGGLYVGCESFSTADFSTVLPGESAIVSMNAKLFWQENSLKLAHKFQSGGIWQVDDLKAGIYQIRFTYYNLLLERGCYDPKTMKEKRLKHVWGGGATTAAIEVRLVQP